VGLTILSPINRSAKMKSIKKFFRLIFNMGFLESVNSFVIAVSRQKNRITPSCNIQGTDMYRIGDLAKMTEVQSQFLENTILSQGK
jgi:hypothetical protein